MLLLNDVQSDFSHANSRPIMPWEVAVEDQSRKKLLQECGVTYHYRKQNLYRPLKAHAFLANGTN